MAPGPLDPRIDRMYRGDRLWAGAAIAVLWLLFLFVFIAVAAVSADSNVNIVLAIAGGLVLLFNTAAIFTMIRHYAEDKEHIYGLDLYYLDARGKAPGRAR